RPSLAPTHPRGPRMVDAVKPAFVTARCQLRDKRARVAPGNALPGERRRDSVGERPGTAPEGRRRAARRLRARAAPPGGRLVARPPRRAPAPARDPVRRPRPSAAPDRRLPLLLRA